MNPYMYVPEIYIDDVCDFAEIHGFRFTEPAKRAIESIRGIPMNVVDAVVEYLPQNARIIPDLEVPQFVDIDPSLRDSLDAH